MIEPIILDDDFVNMCKTVYNKCLKSEKQTIDLFFETMNLTPSEFLEILKDGFIIKNDEVAVMDLTSDGVVRFFDHLFEMEYSEEQVNQIVSAFQLLPNLQYIMMKTLSKEVGGDLGISTEEIDQLTIQSINENAKEVGMRFGVPVETFSTFEGFLNSMTEEETNQITYNTNQEHPFECTNDAKLKEISRNVYSKKLTESEDAFFNAFKKGEIAVWLGDLYVWSYLINQIKEKHKGVIRPIGRNGIFKAAIMFFNFRNNTNINFTSSKASDYAFKVANSDDKHKKTTTIVTDIITLAVQ